MGVKRTTSLYPRGILGIPTASSSPLYYIFGYVLLVHLFSSIFSPSFFVVFRKGTLFEGDRRCKKKEKKSPIIILFPLPHKKLNPTQKEESHPQHHHPKMNPE